MGMLHTLSRVFRRGEGSMGTGADPVNRWERGAGGTATAEGKPTGSLRAGVSGVGLEGSVEVELESDGNGDASVLEAHARAEDGVSMPPHDVGMPPAAEMAPRNKQELLAELTKNYREVVALVRKVDEHLDRQDRRSERLLELAERMPAAVESLEQIRKRHGELTGAIGELTAAVRESAGRAGASADEQLETLGQMKTLLERSGKAEREVAGAIGEFRGSVQEVAGSNARLATVLETINTRDVKRDRRLEEMVEQSQKWTFVLVLLCGAGVATAVVLGVIAVL